MKKQWYVKERNNPQLKAPYYTGCSQLTKKEAKKKEECLYGYNVMLAFSSEQEYMDFLSANKLGAI